MNQQTLHDAGLLRAYIHERGLASVLVYGGTMKSYLQLRRMAKRTGRMIGTTTDDVLAHWREDYETSDKWN